MEDLFSRINEAIDIEYDSKNQDIEQSLKLPVEDRVKKGDTITDVKADFHIGRLNVSGTNEKVFDKVHVFCKENISKFREGSPVILHGHGYHFKCEILEDNGEVMLLGIGWGMETIHPKLQNSSGWQIDNQSVDIRHIVKKSTGQLNWESSKRNKIKDILEGSLLPNYSDKRIAVAKALISKTNLNPSQRNAFINAYSSNNYHLIQGPPGSGKTILLAHLAIAFANEGKKVLVTAPTHTAINNALQKASLISHYPHIIKVGKKIQAENLNYDGSTAKNIADLRNSDYTNDSKGVIVGATCYSPYTKKLEFMDWDVIIVDEAGQLSIPLGVGAMAKGEKYIFIGDHKQLPPIISENQTDPIFTKSIFEKLFKHAPGDMLDITYRMNKWINRFPSKRFYDGKLIPDKKNENWLLNIPNSFDKHKDILDVNKPEVLFCHFHTNSESRSEFEANLAAELTFEYLSKGVKPVDIAIITPYRAQVRMLKNKLSSLIDYKEIIKLLFIDTVERIQGQERDVVIYSFATSNPEKALQRVEFFFNPNRLNVGLTRAKKKRIVIANKELFELSSENDKLNKYIDNFKAFYEDSTVIEEQIDDLGKDLF